MDSEPPKLGALRRFFSNPVVGVAGSIASIVGLGLALVLYLHGLEYSRLVYVVNPSRPVVVDSKQASGFTVLHHDEKVDTDVVVAQIAIWNSGKRSIKPEHILEPITVQVGNGARILEAKIHKSTRGVVGLELDRSQMNDGRIAVRWRILERNDGGVIQVLYAGPPSAAIGLTGMIEGQRRVAGRQFVPDPAFNLDFILARHVSLAALGAALAGLTMFALGTVGVARLAFPPPFLGLRIAPPVRLVLRAFLTVMGVLYVVAAAMIPFVPSDWPPFDF